ncbi:RrF2 family transcriptional regulator [Candidatus Omnitrophota bacterium]
MLIEKKGYYYIKTVLFFAFSKKRSFSNKEISERLEISEKVMEQVLLALKNSGILQSKRGPQGGYRLALDISGLTLGDVLERTGQRIDILPHDVRGKKNPLDEVLSGAAALLKKGITKDLGKITIKSMRKRIKERVTETGLDYII